MAKRIKVWSGTEWVDVGVRATYNGTFYNTGGYKYYKFTANGNITF